MKLYNCSFSRFLREHLMNISYILKLYARVNIYFPWKTYLHHSITEKLLLFSILLTVVVHNIEFGKLYLSSARDSVHIGMNDECVCNKFDVKRSKVH